MSFPALGWASQQRTARATDKLVLLALADRHNEEEDASWPSVAWLADFCCLDRKTIITCLDRLEAAGFISDSGIRTGKTMQVKVYRLALNSTEKGIPETGPLKGKSTAFSVKQSQKRDTEPSSEPSCSTETTSLPSITRERAPSLACPRDVNEQVWKDFVAMRRSKRAPISETALAGIKREADKAGWSLNDALAECAARGWQGFNSTWVQENRNDRQRTPFAKPTTREIGERVAAKLAARRA